MPRQKPNAPQRLGDDQRQAQNWRMGEPSQPQQAQIRAGSSFQIDDDDDSYVSEEDLVHLC